MKSIIKLSIHRLVLLGSASLLAGCATTSVPEVSHDGLVRVKGARVDVVYALPGADLSGYNKVILLEPQISFRTGWKSDINSGRNLRRITDDDMQKMIAMGEKLLIEEFAKALEKGGYSVVSKRGSDVLAVKPAIIDLDVFAPDPDNMSGVWMETYSNGSGEATLYLELYDSVTEQILVRAIDTKTDRNDGFTWRIPRTQATNIQDARAAIGDWARMLVKGLDNARTAKSPATAGAQG